MLKGLAITPPVIGRISIGRVVESKGRRLPEKDDQFTLTTQVQNREGWVLHPLDEALRKTAGAKLRAIPVHVPFNDPDLNLRAQFTAFDRQTGRPLCVGDGETCRRVTENGMQDLPCPTPEACAFGGGYCKPYGRLNVVIGDEDEIGTFVFRTTSFNSIRTLTARLQYYQAASGNVLASMPLELKLRGKSTTQSHRAPIYYVDLVIRAGLSLEAAVAQARELDGRRNAAGFDQQALDEAARRGFAGGAFEDSSEEALAVVEEFYPGEAQQAPSDAEGPTDLKEKLRERM
ncbi:recombination directionality factor [Solimonas marina]|uniref:Hydrolase or metal-binding protein n=1 Tax=Solimonas marina TaxID=2714601 RepID=A0A969WEF3_9GAMM|nr:hydrolase or metal-binding protein [Solimonas marina]NKF24513.1 hydrolase or metal-binding protein [Solimonas marina]